MFEQALVARRQEHFAYRAETELEFEPSTFQQAAGLAAYYNRQKFHCLAVTWHETLGRALTILSSQGDPEGRLTFPLASPIALRRGMSRCGSRSRSTAPSFNSPPRLDGAMA